MHKFASLKKEIRFRKVVFYSVCLEGEADSLFLDFVNKHTAEEYNEQLAVIRAWLRKLGAEIGAQERYFRFEGSRGGDARALPPPAKYLDIECRLRLYCMRINEQSVVLFSGAEKTADKAQDCDQVRPHFQLANRLAKAIDQAIREGEITISPETGWLIYADDLNFAYE